MNASNNNNNNNNKNTKFTSAIAIHNNKILLVFMYIRVISLGEIHEYNNYKNNNNSARLQLSL